MTENLAPDHWQDLDAAEAGGRATEYLDAAAAALEFPDVWLQFIAVFAGLSPSISAGLRVPSDAAILGQRVITIEPLKYQVRSDAHFTDVFDHRSSAYSARTDLYRIHLRANVPRVSAEATKTPDRRPYRSKLREQQAAATRRAVVDGACGLFVANGWAATGMREVAAAAGVAVETVYSHFSSKRGLLQAVLDIAVVGDDAPVALAERDEFLALGKGRRSARIRAAARGLTAIQVRTASVAVLLRQAAPADEEVAEMLRATRERQRIDHAAGFELVNGRAPSRTERDGVWAIASPEVYLLLVEESGWSPEEYEAWIAELLAHVIPRS